MPAPLPPKINPVKTNNGEPSSSHSQLNSSSKDRLSLVWFLLPFPGLIILIPISLHSQNRFTFYFYCSIAFLICIFSAYWISKNIFNRKGIGLILSIFLFTCLLVFINVAFSFPLGCCITLIPS